MNLVSRHHAGYKLTFEYQHLSRDLCGSLHLSYVRNSLQTLKTFSACTETGGKVDSTLESGIIGVAGIMGVGGKFPNEK